MKLEDLKEGDTISYEQWDVIYNQTDRTHSHYIQTYDNGTRRIFIQRVNGDGSPISGEKGIAFYVAKRKTNNND